MHKTILIYRDLVRQPRNGGMHLGPSESLGIYNLARGHLYQGRTPKKDLCLILHQDSVVGYSGEVRPSSGRRAEDDAARELAGSASARKVSEHLACAMEDAELLREISACLLNRGKMRS